MKTPFLFLLVLLPVLASHLPASERLEDYTNKTILVFTPHPDDDTFAVGGTMALLAKNKNRVVVDDDVAMAKIEIWGSNNDIELPYGLNPYFTQVGKNNVVHNRPAPWAGSATSGVETTRTTTVVELDENGPPTVTTVPGSSTDSTHRNTATAAPERKTRTEPTNPESIP